MSKWSSQHFIQSLTKVCNTYVHIFLHSSVLLAYASPKHLKIFPNRKSNAPFPQSTRTIAKPLCRQRERYEAVQSVLTTLTPKTLISGRSVGASGFRVTSGEPSLVSTGRYSGKLLIPSSQSRLSGRPVLYSPLLGYHSSSHTHD